MSGIIQKNDPRHPAFGDFAARQAKAAKAAAIDQGPEYNAGFAIGQTRGELPADASDKMKVGYLAGMAVGPSANVIEQTSNLTATSPNN